LTSRLRPHTMRHGAIGSLDISKTEFIDLIQREPFHLTR
jgi:hypothetical protein